MIRRAYLTLDARQVHVLSAGRGPALVMLHAPPLWARTLEPLITRLAAHFLVVAPDLPGYGLSDALPTPSPTVADYAADLARILQRLGVGSFALYAAEESAPIAAALAALDCGRLKALVLDEPFAVSAAERATMLANGLPEFAPEPTGSHLLRLWDAARSRFLFRPAHVPRLANRLDLDMASPTELDEVVKAYLRAGDGYPAALRAGLTAPPLDATLGTLGTPVLVLAAERTQRERLPAEGSGVRIVRLPPSLDTGGRAAAIVEFLAEQGLERAAAIRWPAMTELPTGELSRLFIPVRGGHLHAGANFGGSGRPVLAMHDPAGSHALVLPFVGPMVGTRPVIALDMPGNGESDNTVGTRDVTSARYAMAVIDALDALGMDEVDVIGRYSGGPIGMEMSFQRPALVKHLAQAAIDVYEPTDVADLLASYTPSVAARRDGSHLVLAWHEMQNQALFWPWFRQSRAGIVWGEPQLDPRLIHQRVFDLLRVGDMYQKAYAAMWTYPMAERLPALTVPTLLGAPRWDPIYAGLARAHRIAPRLCAQTLPDRFVDWAAIFMRFFDGHEPPAALE